MHLRAFRATMSGMRDLYPCPCCGHLVFEEPPGSDDICMICFWEDDVMQLRWPQLAGVTNAVSLLEAQRNFARLGASEQRFAGDVRPPTATERLDEGWRPIQENDRFEEPEDSAPWPEDRTRLYYWRPTFWRARS
jgi:hypothetical protein